MAEAFRSESCDVTVTWPCRFGEIYRGLRRSTGVTRRLLTLWICNGNRNLQHAVADRQSNFQACSFNHSDISPFRINNLRAAKHQIIARRLRLPTSLTSRVNPTVYGRRTAPVRGNCVTPRNLLRSLRTLTREAGSRCVPHVRDSARLRKGNAPLTAVARILPVRR